MGVCSRLTYGSEVCRLNDKACAMFNGSNIRMLSPITHKSSHEESSSVTRIQIPLMLLIGFVSEGPSVLGTCSAWMKGDWCARWLKVLSEGDMFMDVPTKFSWCELLELTKDRVGWLPRVMALRKNASHTTTTSSPMISIRHVTLMYFASTSILPRAFIVSNTSQVKKNQYFTDPRSILHNMCELISMHYNNL